jgi:hypothetical protein
MLFTGNTVGLQVKSFCPLKMLGLPIIYALGKAYKKTGD